MPKTNWEKLQIHAYDDLTEDFNPVEIYNINFKNPYVVYAIDKFMSGWGPSKKRKTHTAVICWNLQQAVNVEERFNELTKEFSHVYRQTLESFLQKHFHGIWLIKNGNDCPVWNKGTKVNLTEKGH